MTCIGSSHIGQVADKHSLISICVSDHFLMHSIQTSRSCSQVLVTFGKCWWIDALLPQSSHSLIGTAGILAGKVIIVIVCLGKDMGNSRGIDVMDGGVVVRVVVVKYTERVVKVLVNREVLGTWKDTYRPLGETRPGRRGRESWRLKAPHELRTFSYSPRLPPLRLTASIRSLNHFDSESLET